MIHLGWMFFYFLSWLIGTVHFSHCPLRLPLQGQLSMLFHLCSFFQSVLENFAVPGSFLHPLAACFNCKVKYMEQDYHTFVMSLNFGVFIFWPSSVGLFAGFAFKNVSY
jgi:hypothetical protein